MATEQVSIELNLRGYEGVYSDLRKLDSMLQGFSGAKGKKTIELDAAAAKKELLALSGSIHDSEEAVERYRRKIRDLKRELRDLNKEEAKDDAKIKEKQADLDKTIKSREEEIDKLRDLRTAYKDVTQRINEYNNALKNSQTSFMDIYKKTSTGLKHIGQNMQTLGNVLTRIGTPFNRITTGLLYGAGFKMLNKFTEGLSSGFERYDTLNKYARNLQLNFGKTAEEADALKGSLNDAVEGLPTSLDEIINMANQFTASMGDADKAAKLAIAVNNAFLASQSGETARYQGMMQLRDVIGGKDMNAREWQSLAQSMLPAIRMIGEEMGLTGQELNDYVASVQQGKIANQEFLDQLIKYGTSGKIVETARLAMDTWEAFFARIGTASSRLMYGVLTSLDELVATVTGGKIKSLNMFLDGQVIPTIDNMTASIKSWIKAHPDEIINFFKSLKNIDIKGFAEGIVDGVKTVVNAIQWLTETFGGAGGKAHAIGWFMTIAGPLGRGISMLGGVLKGLSHPLALIWAALAKLGIMVGGEFKKRGIFDAIGTAIFGKKGSKATKELIDGAKEATAAPKAMETLRGVADSLSGVLKAAGMVAIPTITAWGAVKALKSIINDCKEIGELVYEVDWRGAATALGGFTVFIGAFAKLGDAMGKMDDARMLQTLKGEAYLGAITAIATAIADVDMFFIKDVFKQFRDVTTYLGEAISNIKGLKSFDTGKATERIKNTISAMSEVYAALKVTDDEGKSLMAASNTEITAMRGIISGMTDIMTDIVTVSDTMKTLDGASLISKKKAVEVGKKVGGILEGLGEAFSGYLGTDFGYDPADLSSNMTSTIENFNTALDTIIGEDGLLARMRRVVSQTADVPGVQSVGSVMGSVKRLLSGDGGLFGNLKEIVQSAGDVGDTEELQSKMHNFSVAFGSIRNIFTKMAEIDKIKPKGSEKNAGDFGAIKMVKRLISQLKTAFTDNSGIDELRSDVQGFVNDMNGLMDSMTAISGEHVIDVSVKLKANKVVGTEKVVSAIKRANSEIAKAVMNIKTYYTKTIYVHIKTNVSNDMPNVVPTDGSYGPILPGSDDGNGGATGGMFTRNGVLYRSRGGSVFKPRGVDRIPAMLAEGEYVHKKQAVDFFGTDFMQKVNAMDVKGAMQALLTKAGNSTNIGRQSIVNNTVNNNQRVTQNINTNNPNFTRVQMGRFAGAL